MKLPRHGSENYAPRPIRLARDRRKIFIAALKETCVSRSMLNYSVESKTSASATRQLFSTAGGRTVIIFSRNPTTTQSVSPVYSRDTWDTSDTRERLKLANFFVAEGKSSLAKCSDRTKLCPPPSSVFFAAARKQLAVSLRVPADGHPSATLGVNET